MTFSSPSDAKAQAKGEKAYRKAQRPWYKKKRFLALAVIALIVIISVASRGGETTTTASPVTNAAPSADAQDSPVGDASAAPVEPSVPDAAPAFPGATDDDVIGQAGDLLDLGDAQVMATPVVSGDSTFGATVCSTVTLSNASDEAIDFNVFDWKLQIPAGTISSTGFGGSDTGLSSGGIAPGGTATGDVCFDAEALAGQYVLFYEPVFAFFSERAAWITTVQHLDNAAATTFCPPWRARSHPGHRGAQRRGFFTGRDAKHCLAHAGDVHRHPAHQ